MSTDIELHERSQSVAEVRRNQIDFTPAQKAILATRGLENVDPADLQALLHTAQKHDLELFSARPQLVSITHRTKVKRGDREVWIDRATHIITVDGILALANRTGRYIGIDQYWCGKDGQWRDVWLEDEPPAAARAVLHYYDKAGIERTAQAVVKWSARAQYTDVWEGTGRNRHKTGEKKLMAQWAEKPDEMLMYGAVRKVIKVNLPEAFDTVEGDLQALNAQWERNAPVVAQSRQMLYAGPRPKVDDLLGDYDDDAEGTTPDGEVRYGSPELPDPEQGEGGVYLSGAQRGEIKRLQRLLGIDDETYRGQLRKLYAVESSKDLYADQARNLIDRLRSKAEKAGLDPDATGRDEEGQGEGETAVDPDSIPAEGEVLNADGTPASDPYSLDEDEGGEQ